VKDDRPAPLSGSNKKKLVPKMVCPTGLLSQRRSYSVPVGKLTETKVASKKVVVTTAIVFIAEASHFTSLPICN
jgi:hypothetical protein